VTDPPSAAIARLARSADDAEAWQQLFGHYWPFVLATNYRMLGGLRELAEDASQDVFLRLIRYRPFRRLKDPAAFKAYLAATCRNVCRDYLRWYLTRDTHASKEETQPSAEVRAPGPSGEDEVLASEALQELLRPLDEDERRVVRYLLEGYGLGDIAQALGITYTNAGVRVHRLRAKLRNYLSNKKIER